MDEQTILNLGVGTIESTKKKLEPKKVKIVQVSVLDVEKVKAKKAVFSCKHPDQEDLINLSAVSVLENKVVRTVGTWVNLDVESKLMKGSALVVFMNRLGVTSLKDVVGLEVDTEQDDSGYLCFKAY